MRKIDRTGETRMQNCGMEAEIIGYRRNDDIDVRFIDNTIVKNKTYNNFKNGSIQNPNIKHTRYKNNEKHIGETQMQNCGQPATIIAYRKNNDIDIRFSDGTIVENRTYCSFKNGKIGHPVLKHKIRDERIGETRIQNCGLPATITAYNKRGTINIRFIDGTEAKDKNYHNFNMGNIKHPTMYTYWKKTIGKIHPKLISRLYNTDIYGIAYIDGNGTYYYYTHCPICGEHNIMTFAEIREHTCNRKIVCERDAIIREHISKINTTAA